MKLSKEKSLRNTQIKGLLFLISLTLIFLIQISAISHPVSAFDPETNIVKANWLYVAYGSYCDNNGESWKNDINFGIGGEDLLSFENLGAISNTETEVLYKARATFGFEFTAYTSVSFRDVFPNINLDARTKVPFLAIVYQQLPINSYSLFSVEWNYINYGSVKNSPDYNGAIPITVGIKDLSTIADSLTVNGITFDIPEIRAEVLQTKVLTLYDGEVGSYSDHFSSGSDVQDGQVVFVENDDFSAKQQKIIDYYNNQKLGFQAGEIQRGQTIYQRIVDGASVGNTFHNNLVDRQQYSFSLPFHLQPEVFEYVQYNKIKRAGLQYWTWGFWAGNLDVLVPPNEWVAPKRVVAVHTTNNYLHWDFQVEVEFFATIKNSAELTSTILSDPFLKMGDWVWDTSITGTDYVEVPLQIQPFFEALFGILMIAVIIIVIILGVWIFAKIGIPFLLHKRFNKRRG